MQSSQVMHQLRRSEAQAGGRGAAAPEGVLEVCPARAQQDELHALAHQPVKALPDQVHALLLVQAPDEGEHRDVRVLRQAQLLQPDFSMRSALPALRARPPCLIRCLPWVWVSTRNLCQERCILRMQGPSECASQGSKHTL